MAYIGSTPVPSGIKETQSFVANAGQITFNTLGYSNGNNISVFLNGVRLINGTDYTATNGSDIVLTAAASASDVLEFETFNEFNLVNQNLTTPTFKNSMTMKNDTEEDTDGGRESTVIFQGEQSGGEISTLAEIEASHDSGADDEKGNLIFKTNDGSDGTSPTEAARIDSSQNLLVGKTSNTFATTGVALNPDGSNNMTRDGDPPLSLNRLTSDGNILNIFKDGSQVGGISSLAGSGIAIANTQTNGFISLFGHNQSNGIFYEDGSSKRFAPYAARDNDIDLGYTTGRWKDLYLSGGAYIGGTVAANHLDDYEEGYHQTTFTPSGSGSITLSGAHRYLRYTKIGNHVYISGKVDVSSVSSPVGYIKVSLPFAIDSTSPAGVNDSRRLSGNVWVTNASINVTQFILYGIEGESQIRIYRADGTVNASTSANTFSGNESIAFNFFYATAS